MNRQETIGRIIWSLLAHADMPHEAVAGALNLKARLGDHAERDFRNLLRAAGLFARDDDGFFIRYVSSACAKSDLSALPSPTHLLTLPVPVEPRMRIAYSVFSGFLLKHLYQCHGTVPLQVAEGMALLWAPEQPPDPATPLPCNADQLWQEFRESRLAEDALKDGIEAMLSAVRAIGSIALTDSLCHGAVFPALLNLLPRHERNFQSQGGMRLDYYSEGTIQRWKCELAIAADSSHTVESLWTQWLNGSDAVDTGKEIAGLIVKEALNAAKPMAFRYARGLWRGEGGGTTRKPGKRDALLFSKTGDKNAETRRKDLDKTIEDALSKLERSRGGTRDLDDWVARTSAGNKHHLILISSIASLLTPVNSIQSGSRSIPLANAGEVVDAPSDSFRKRRRCERFLQTRIMKVVDALSDSFRKSALVSFLNREDTRSLREVKAAVSETYKNVVAWNLSRFIHRDDIAIFGWPVSVLRNVSEQSRFALRFISKDGPSRTKTVLRVPPFGNITLATTQVSRSPFGITALQDHIARERSPEIATVTLASGPRCIVCGSSSDLLKGAISFLPESKKRWYESPTKFEEPKLCSNCAFIAYISAIYPSGDSSVVEFPCDNFLEMFALHEHVQGLSGAVALKGLNRVASLAILPSRYVLLSKNSRQGQIDSKTQIYLQLRHHTPLLRRLDRSMRVQAEGSQPNFWSEIHPHVAVGLSYFAHLPAYYEIGDRKITGQRITRALLDGRPFAGLYLAAQAHMPEDGGFGWERSILPRGIQTFEREFIGNTLYAATMALALGGHNMDCNFYADVIDFSNYLLDLLRPLVDREVHQSKSAVSGIARKYTELIARDFAEGRAAKFLYVVAQEVDSAERQSTPENEKWKSLKWQTMQKLYGESPAVRGKSGEEAAKSWTDFREQHARTLLEERISNLQLKHGKDNGLWSKFLSEVQARTLALLMLNVHNVKT
jgi:hypothetical protein